MANTSVTPIRARDPLAAGRLALTRGAWRDAKRAFETALAREETPDALEGLGLANWWLDSADEVFAARERAYRLYRARNDRVAAARIAVWLAWDSSAFRGEMAVANGWLERAHHLLRGLPHCAEHAWLGVREGIFALLHDGDPALALKLADKSVRVAEEVGAEDYEMVGRALRGFALVTAGRVREGMRQLDEVNAVVLAGELTDPVLIALACCYLVAACERVRDNERAVEWCNRLKQYCTTWGLKPLLAVCRTQYGSVCLWHGDWDTAEQELVTATNELVASRPAMSGEGQARLGELRRRQGRLADATVLFDKAGGHPLALLGRAAVFVDRGDPRKGAELIERYLRNLPRHNRTDRAASLELLVKAYVRADHVAKARAATTQLRTIARAVGTESLLAAGSLAAGRVAMCAHTPTAARRHFEDAVDRYAHSGAPFEGATVRIELASALAELDQPAAALDEVRAAIETLDAAGARTELARARELETRLVRLVGKPGAPANDGGLTRREVDVVRLIATGLSNARIAQRLSISGHTVHRHVANVLTKLGVQTRSAAVARAAQLGLLPAH